MEYSRPRSAWVRGSRVTAWPPPCSRGWTKFRLRVETLLTVLTPLGAVRFHTVLFIMSNVSRAPVLNSFLKVTPEFICLLFWLPTAECGPAHWRMQLMKAVH